MSDELLKVIAENVTALGLAIGELRDQVRRLVVKNDNIHQVDERIVKIEFLLEKLERESEAMAKLVLESKDEVLAVLAGNEKAFGEKLASGLANLRESLLAGDKEVIKRIDAMQSRIDPDRLLIKVRELEANLKEHVRLFEHPVKKEIRYIHLLDYSWVLALTGFIGYVILIVWAFNQLGR